MTSEIKVRSYKETIKAPLRQATICFLVKGDDILLAMKKRGFGVGKWNGVGGKPNDGESVEEAAVRETKEEIGVIPKGLECMAILNFYSLDKPEFDQQVLVYKVTDWEGIPQETEEMAPKWFRKDEIPYDLMWEDDKHWLPLVLDGKKLKGDFLFDNGDKLVDFEILEKN